MNATITETRHGTVVAITAVHDRLFDRRLGGVRFVERGGIEEVRHLAAGMAEKCAASRVPVDGQKTLVICPDGVPDAAEQRAAILAEHIRQVTTLDAHGIFGPDMACGNDVLDLVADDPIVGAHVTGLSEARAGLDINRHAFTARGVVHALDQYTRETGTSLGSAAVQGFGMVGAPVANALWDRGLVVRAISNRTGALLGAAGLDIPCLFALWRELGDDCLAAFAASDSCATFVTNPDALFTVRAELFVPAARTTVLARSDELETCRAENRDARSAEEFLDRSGCSLVLEAANHPLTMAAEELLEARGVAILPDVLANIGGMVGCFAEWRYRSLVRSGAVSIADLADRCHAYTANTVETNVRALVSRGGSARAAAIAIAETNKAAMVAAGGSRDFLELESYAR